MIAKAVPILCDYCDQPATRLISRGRHELRSIVCPADYGRGMSAVRPGYPAGHWVDPPTSEGRSRFEGVDFDVLTRRLRQGRAKRWRLAR